MPANEYLKREILRQTVAENLALIEGVRLAAGRPRHSLSKAWRWAGLIVIAGVFGYIEPPLADFDLPTMTAGLLSRETAAVGSAPREARRQRWASDPGLLVERAPKRIDPSLFPLQVRHIVVDPGHGGEDQGTHNGTLYEKDLTLDIGLRLRDLLASQGFEVSMTRDTDRTMVLKERSDLANRVAADVFVSIHINWLVTRQTRGVETYFLGPTEDPELGALARRENRHSGYSLADQDNIIRSVILNAQHERSGQLAGRVQQSLFRFLRPVNPSLQDRGVKMAPFVVLVDTEMPAILAEVSCLSNAKEVELLRRPLYLDHIAEALAKGIHGYARDVSSTEADPVGP